LQPCIEAVVAIYRVAYRYIWSLLQPYVVAVAAIGRLDSIWRLDLAVCVAVRVAVRVAVHVAVCVVVFFVVYVAVHIAVRVAVRVTVHTPSKISKLRNNVATLCV